MLTDGRTTDAGVTGILIAHLGAFGSGELINVDQSKSNDVHNNPGCEYDSGRVYTICMVISTAHDLTSCPSGKRVWLQSQKTRIDSRMRTYFQCVFSFFFNILMLNNFIYQ